MLEYAGHVSNEPRGYMTLGTGPLNRFYQGSDEKWFFLAVSSADADTLWRVEGVNPDDLEGSFRHAPAADWVRRLRAHGLAAQARVPVAELMQDAYVIRCGLSVTQQVDGVGATTAPGLPVRLSRTPMRVGDPPRPPGSDAAVILQELGFKKPEALANLERAWVLQVNDLPSAWA
jgi:hypothetical protein